MTAREPLLFRPVRPLPGTACYFRAKAVGDDGTPVYGAEKTFTPGVGAPSVIGVTTDKGSPGDELTVTISGSNLSGVISVDSALA